MALLLSVMPVSLYLIHWVWVLPILFISDYAPAGITFLSFALFMGIAMSITAFPVLARILQEKGLTRSKLGAMALTCAAADDLTAWCILAAVIALVKSGSSFSVFLYNWPCHCLCIDHAENDSPIAWKD